MDTLVDYLKQLDLSDAEAKLYLMLLQSGPTSVRDLAQTVAIKRTTTYFYIDQLVEKGLIMKLVKGSKKLVAANEPDQLKTLVEEKLKKAQEVQKGFPEILKTLTTTVPQVNNTNDADIKYFKGMNNVKKIYEDAFSANDVCSYVKLTESDEAGKVFTNNISTFEEAFNRNPKLVLREILYDSPLTKEQAPKLLAKNNRYSFKFMPKDLQLSSEDILIFDGKVAIINYKGNVSSVVLHSVDYYKNSKELFEFIWKILP
jgi:sugar-specific transcriptional regulator TrmB